MTERYRRITAARLEFEAAAARDAAKENKAGLASKAITALRGLGDGTGACVFVCVYVQRPLLEQ